MFAAHRGGRGICTPGHMVDDPYRHFATPTVFPVYKTKIKNFLTKNKLKLRKNKNNPAK
jgi:hypothetical protein